tara:strand:+ start:2841 stop:4154 length:1314 start_codon:yes stop_codon:yes gene_type:complete
VLNIDAKFTKTQGQAIKYLFDNNTTEILYGGAAGGGKSFIGCAWIILLCIKYPKTRYLIGRSKLDTLKKTTLNTFFEVCSLYNIKSGQHYTFNGSTNIITFFNGSEVILKDLFLYPSDRNFDSLGSLEITGAFIDECNQITEKAKNIVASRIRYKLDEYNIIPKMFLSCNPAKNWVYTEYYRPSKTNTLPPYKKFIQALVDDNKFVSKHYKGQLEKLDRLSKERLLYGNWEYDASEDNLIEYNSILNLFSQTGLDGSKYITCDVARFGNDKSVVMLWNGLTVTNIKTFDTNTITELADYIKTLQQKEGVNTNNILADEDGLGGGLIDILRIKGFQNNSRPLKNENYQNLKTQCYYKLADIINKGQLGIVNDNINTRQHIIEELEQVRSKDADKDSKNKIVDKDTIKAILGRSPDYADCLAMRMYFEIDSNYGKYFVQ